MSARAQSIIEAPGSVPSVPLDTIDVSNPHILRNDFIPASLCTSAPVRSGPLPCRQPVWRLMVSEKVQRTAPRRHAPGDLLRIHGKSGGLHRRSIQAPPSLVAPLWHPSLRWQPTGRASAQDPLGRIAAAWPHSGQIQGMGEPKYMPSPLVKGCETLTVRIKA